MTYFAHANSSGVFAVNADGEIIQVAPAWQAVEELPPGAEEIDEVDLWGLRFCLSCIDVDIASEAAPGVERCQDCIDDQDRKDRQSLGF